MRRTRLALTFSIVAAATMGLAGNLAAEEPALHAGHDHPPELDVAIDPELGAEAERAIKASGDAAWSSVRLDIDATAHDLPAVDHRSIPVSILDAMLPVELPVLVPSSLTPALQGGYLYGTPDQYSLSLDQDGVTVLIAGSRRAMVYPHLEVGSMDAFQNAHGAVVSRTHGIVSAAFERYGVAYQIDVECAAPLEDVRCTEDAYVNRLIDELSIAGGTLR